jgi:hypothetical protein
MGRRILEAYEASHRRGETRICFLKITPDPVILTYMVGYSIWETRRHMESAAAKVVVHAPLEGGQSSLPVAPQSPRDT